MKKETKEIALTELEELMEKKGSKIQSSIWISKEIQKVTEEVDLSKEKKEQVLEELDFLKLMSDLELDAIKHSIHIIVKVIARDSIRKEGK